MTSFSDSFVGQAWTQSWQILVVAILAAGLAWTVGRRHAHLSYLLWMVVLLKALTPPVFVSPTSVFSWSEDLGRSAPAPAVWNPPQDAAPSVPAATVPSATATTIVPGESTLHGVSWGVLLAVVWSCGALLALGFRVVAHARFRRRLARASVESDERLSARVAAVSRRVGLSRSPRLLITSLPIGPAVFGIWRTIIVLPQSALDEDRLENLEAVLAHELVHVRRRDPLHALVQLAAVSLWWWNPVVWFASRAATRERERCCDEEVLGTLGCPGEFYAQCMLDTLRSQVRPAVVTAPLALTALPLTRRRLESIMRRGRRFRSRAPRWLWAAAIVLGAALLPGGGEAQRSAPAREPAWVARVDLSDDKLRPTDLNPPTETPQVVCLAWWDVDDIDGIERPSPRAAWDVEGRTLSQRRAAEFFQQVSFNDPERFADDSLHPLLVVFRVDRRIAYCMVVTTVITDDGKRHFGGGSTGGTHNGFVTSTAYGSVDSMGKWPRQISLEIKYPIDNRTIVESASEIPDDPVEIAPGVRWYLDPKLAAKIDKQTDEWMDEEMDGRIDRWIGKFQRAFHRSAKRTTAVLEIRYDVPELTWYEMWVYDEEWQSRGRTHGSWSERNGRRHALHATHPFDNKDQIKHVLILRQRHQISRIDNVPIRLDLLPEKK